VKVLAEVQVPNHLKQVSFAPYDSSIIFASGSGGFMRLYKYNELSKGLRVFPEFIPYVEERVGSVIWIHFPSSR
jgi:hypothetical protein